MRTIEEMTTAVALPMEYGTLVSRFLLVFSRFEAALKRAGYAQQKGDQLIVEWKRFARENPPETGHEPKLTNALRPLIECPPERQQVVDDHLEFVSEAPGKEPICTEWLLEMVYRVRNNLFHGGKWPIQPERDAELLNSCLAALGYFVDLKTEVAQAYFDR